MSNSVRPHRQKHIRLPCPWDSPGKSTGVVCHFLLQCMKVKSEREVSQSCMTRSDPMDCSPPGSSIHGIFQARGLEWGAIAFSDPLCYHLLKYKYDHFSTLLQFQFSSVTRSCPTLCDPMNRSIPGLPVYQLPDFTQSHVH